VNILLIRRHQMSLDLLFLVMQSAKSPAPQKAATSKKRPAPKVSEKGSSAKEPERVPSRTKRRYIDSDDDDADDADDDEGLQVEASLRCRQMLQCLGEPISKGVTCLLLFAGQVPARKNRKADKDDDDFVVDLAAEDDSDSSFDGLEGKSEEDDDFITTKKRKSGAGGRTAAKRTPAKNVASARKVPSDPVPAKTRPPATGRAASSIPAQGQTASVRCMANPPSDSLHGVTAAVQKMSCDLASFGAACLLVQGRGERQGPGKAAGASKGCAGCCGRG
jgi:hypothetical protein